MARILDKLRKLIRESGESAYSISRGSGVTESQLSRFLREQAGLSAENIERIANYLHYDVVFKSRRRSRSEHKDD